MKNQITKNTHTIKRPNGRRYGQYVVTVNGQTFDNYQSHLNQLSYHTENEFDEPIQICIRNGITYMPTTKKEFVDAVYHWLK